MNAGLRCLVQGMDMLPLVMSIDRQPELWIGNKILLRRGDANYVAFDMVPQVRPFVFGTMSRVEGEVLGKVWIERVSAGELISLPQLGLGQHYYISVLEAPAGAVLATPLAEVPLAAGSSWWADGSANPQIRNGGGFPVSILILEITPNSPGTVLPEG